MKKIIFFLQLVIISQLSIAQPVYDAAYARSLYAKYPTFKSQLCPGCKEWDNPYFQAISDTTKHQPIITYYVYTKAHQDAQIALKIPRSSEADEWHPATGQQDISGIYTTANKAFKNPIDKLVYGHCIAWITLAWCEDAAIFSNTEGFNEGMEVQGQNIGTELATENICRKILSQGMADSVFIWCGVFGSQKIYTDGKTLVVMPEYYWKVIDYFDKQKGEQVERCWIMPNKVTETQELLPQRTSK